MAQRIIDRGYVGEVLQHVYDSDLDVDLSLISKGGYFYLTAANKRIPLRGTSIEEVVTDLAFRLAAEFPESKFASWWTNNFREEDHRRRKGD